MGFCASIDEMVEDSNHKLTQRIVLISFFTAKANVWEYAEC